MKRIYVQPEVKVAKAFTEEIMGEIVIGSDGQSVVSDTGEDEEDDYGGTFRTEETHLWEDLYYRYNVWQQ